MVATSASQGRDFIRGALDEWGLTSLLDDALLLTSELVTNALLHAGAREISLRVCRLADGVRVEVTDRSPALPRTKPARGRSAGRGLALVEAWSRRWGIAPAPPGKTVWFEVGSR